MIYYQNQLKQPIPNKRKLTWITQDNQIIKVTWLIHLLPFFEIRSQKYGCLLSKMFVQSMGLGYLKNLGYLNAQNVPPGLLRRLLLNIKKTNLRLQILGKGSISK